MIEEIKMKWVVALRSGRYKQSKRALKKIDGKGEISHCCLGVLCEIHSEETDTPFTNIESFDNIFYYNNNTTSLPLSVLKWSGLDRRQYAGSLHPISLVEVRYMGRESNLAYLNDSVLDFAKIADLIEEQL